MLKQVTLDGIEPLAIGAGILGTGGGGDPYMDSLQLRSEIQARGPQMVVDPQVLADDATIVIVGYIGAPTASIEKIQEGTELMRSVRLMEKHLNKSVDAIGIAEIGGGNSMGPLITGLQMGLPTVDADGMGRAFPELPMTTFLFNDEIHAAPFAMADAGENAIVVPQTVNDEWAERIARTITVSMGATAGLAGFVMTGAQFRQYCIPHTLTLAWQIGQHVLEARRQGADVPDAIASTLHGRVLLRGKISDIERRTTEGFAKGTITIDGYDRADSNTEVDRLHIEFQNEFLIAYLNGEAQVTVPDLICIVTEEEGEPVATELLRYGMRVAVLGVPAPPQLKTERALSVVGPQAFGYREKFAPLPGGVIGVE